jgi:dipeptidyl aminopeptidase/acylaminoacyl peptidase
VPLQDSERLTREFERVGVTHKLIVIDDGNHGFRNPVHRKQATDAMIAWFGEKLN